MRRTLARATLLSATAALAACPAAEAKTTCRSGKTDFQGSYQGRALRVFEVAQGRASSRPSIAFYLCRGRKPKPRRFYLSDEATFASLTNIRRVGKRLLFAIDTTSETSGSTQIAYLDVATLVLRNGYLEEENGPVPVGFDIASDGTVGFVRGDPADKQEVGIMRTKGKDELRAPQILQTVDAGGIDLASVRITADAITWRTTAPDGSVPRPK